MKQNYPETVWSLNRGHVFGTVMERTTYVQLSHVNPCREDGSFPTAGVTLGVHIHTSVLCGWSNRGQGEVIFLDKLTG